MFIEKIVFYERFFYKYVFFVSVKKIRGFLEESSRPPPYYFALCIFFVDMF